jgi:hypothetical protein
MAKNNAQKKGKPANKAGRKRSSRRVVVSSGLTPIQRLLANPCDATPISYYGGESGIVQRFVQDFSANTTAGYTCGFVVFIPASNSYLTGGNALPTAAISPLFFVGPATTFLGASANKTRPLAACITAIPSAVSVTNMTGEVGVAVISSSLISTLSTYSVDGIFQIANQRSVLSKREYDVKWFPGQLDSSYATVLNTGGSAGTAPLSDPSDNNAILLAWRGYPAATSLSIRLTNVVEWTPVTNIGMAVTSTPTMPHNVQAHAAVMSAKKPSWWHTLGEGFKDDAQMVARYAGRKAMSYGLRVAENRAIQYLEGVAEEAAIVVA